MINPSLCHHKFVVIDDPFWSTAYMVECTHCHWREFRAYGSSI